MQLWHTRLFSDNFPTIKAEGLLIFFFFFLYCGDGITGQARQAFRLSVNMVHSSGECASFAFIYLFFVLGVEKCEPFLLVDV